MSNLEKKLDQILKNQATAFVALTQTQFVIDNETLKAIQNRVEETSEIFKPSATEEEAKALDKERDELMGNDGITELEETGGRK